MTSSRPKCLLPIASNRTILEFQLDALAECDIQHVTVMAGFGAAEVERSLVERNFQELEVELRVNALYPHSDNLVTAWMASREVSENFVLLNGDTLFEPRLLRRLLERAEAPATVAIDRKDAFDSDDMRVWLDGTRVEGIGKAERARPADAEAIGLYVFRDGGVSAFRSELERAVAQPGALRAWYPPVVEQLAKQVRVESVSIEGLWWTEIDVLEDLEKARVAIGSHQRALRQVLSAAEPE